jgi:hypothetical protein
MTGYTTLTNHTYVAAYQAELRAELLSSGNSRNTLVTVNRLAELWQDRTGNLKVNRGVPSASQTR